MNFKDITSNIKLEYRTLATNVVNEFYIPALSVAKTYYRAVGYFSSTILLSLTYGLANFVKNGGKMKLLISPQLSKEDYEAIENGYELKKYVENKMVNNFNEIVNFENINDRFALLSYMIEHDILDIKVVALERLNDRAMYHEKTGIMIDSDNNIISFSGSANETNNAYYNNYENIDVYCSWKSEDSNERCRIKLERFNSIWDGNEIGLITLDFPKVIKDKILKYSPTTNTFDLDANFINKAKNDNNGLREYQINAINKWEEYGYIGIFDMATGTGKTFTSCGAILRLKEKKGRVLVIVCCPYTHLVNQWYEQVIKFEIPAIKCFGAKQKYLKELDRLVSKFKRKVINFMCLITTNATFQAEHIQKIYIDNLDNCLLVADEAHNFGAFNLSKTLENKCRYRLALSATIERKNDDIGTQAIYDFFGKKCIEYSLEKAIAEGFLSNYYYYPIVVTLNSEELEQYLELTRKISKWAVIPNHENNETYKMYLIKRSRLIAGAKNKITKLYEIIQNFKDKNNLLVYCGAIKYDSEKITSNTSEEIRQINKIVNDLNNIYSIKATEFTSNENNEERQNIINAYKNSEIQALVAIKCLDEGVDIPSIETAFILASSTNPKEYIQRRGRVLRLSPETKKKYAYIYDFVTLPFSLEKAKDIPFACKKPTLGLVKREFDRINEFSKVAMNTADSNKIIDTIEDVFEINKIKFEGDSEEYE